MFEEEPDEKLSPSNMISQKMQIDFGAVKKFLVDENDEDFNKKMSQYQREVTNSQNDQDNIFTCIICFKIVVDAKQCNKCEKMFCQECISGHTKVNGRSKCPMKCSYPQYNKMTKFMYDHFVNRRFSCPIDECPFSQKNSEEGLIYNEALIHLKSCKYRNI